MTGLPDFDPEALLDALRARPRPDGFPPAGVQQLATVRDGDSLRVGLRGRTLDQPGVVKGGRLHWGIDRDREWFVAATDAEALAKAVSSGPDRRPDDGRVEATTSLSADRNGGLKTTVPSALDHGSVPVPDGAVDVDLEAVRERMGIAGPVVDPPAPGRCYLLVAERFRADGRRAVALSFLTPVRVAESLTPATVADGGGTFAGPLLTADDRQAEVLIDLPRSRRLGDRLDRIAEPTGDDARAAVAGDPDADPSVIAAAVERLARAGATARLARP